MNRDDLEILRNATPGGEMPPDFAIKLLEDTCLRSGLDWKARHLYLMKRGGKWGVTLSIDGFRLIGSQNPDYAGQVGPLWVTKEDGSWTDIPPDGPIYASKVGIQHKSGAITWGVAKFKDYQAGPMWSKFPSTMVAKCAEMLAWRKAMPGQLGGLYGTEEMAQAERGKREQTPAADDQAIRNFYLTALTNAKTLDEVKAVGKAVQEDKAISEDGLMSVHLAYTEAKGRF